MWPKFVNSKLFASLLTVTITVITTIAVQGFVSKEKYKEMLKKDLDKKAPYEYVDTQISNVKDNLRQHIEENQKTNEIMLKYLESIATDVRDIKTKR